MVSERIPPGRKSPALRTEVRDTLGRVLERGFQDGTIRPDVTAFDIIVFGALLAQPLPHVPDWKKAVRRQAAIYLDGAQPRRPAESLGGSPTDGGGPAA